VTQLSRRRLLLSTGALFLPAALRAQPAGRVRRLAYLALYPPQARNAYTDHLRLGLRELGYVEGRHYVLEHRHADGQLDRLPEVARQVAREAPDVIVTGVNAFTRAAQQATKSIPIVMVVGTNVVDEGFVRSLSQPGGNVTGLTWDAGLEVYSKRVEFLKEILPNLTRVAVLWDEGQDAAAFRRVFQNDATDAGLTVIWLEMAEDLEPLLAQAVRDGAQALVTGGGTRIFRRRKEVAGLAAKHRLPDMHYDSAFVEEGGLISYAPSLQGLFKRSAVYVDRILKGADPAGLPVEQPTKFDLVINRSRANALGITMPQSLLLRADRFVE
jgi:putative tryptophan/tyrosine transport system substrate-binding protein